MFSNRGNTQYVNDPVSSNTQLDNIPNLTPDIRPDFAKLKSYIIYLLIIATFSFAIAAYIKQKNNSPQITEISQLEEISNSIFIGNTPNTKQINLFLYHWGNLSKNEQRGLRSYPWFQQFSATLQDRISHNIKSGDSNAFQHKNNTDLLRTLAIVIDARHVRPVTNRPAMTTASATQSRQAPSHSSRKIERSSNTQHLSTESTNKRGNTNHNKNKLSINRSASTTIASSSTAKITSAEPQGQPQVKSHKTKQAALTSQHKPKASQQATHRKVVANSSRHVTKHKNKTIALNSASERKRFSTKPTPAELYKVVNQYIDGYEQGDVQKILSLLSFNARTNSANNAKEIEVNLKQLFDSTKDRQLFIRNIKWKFKNNIAKGVGDIQTLILPKDNSGVVATKGMIQIIAKKINNTVLVTHIYTTKHSQ